MAKKARCRFYGGIKVFPELGTASVKCSNAVIGYPLDVAEGIVRRCCTGQYYNCPRFIGKRVYCGKKQFVEGELASAIRSAAPEVLKVEYIKDKDGELVRVSFEGGGNKAICVTADSKTAIAADVFNKLIF
ncbi:MAG: hypothetical protein BWY15_00455 [Firmicutes bacterium ADurb.Bin193]|nr:MAG: hypothetical protein BWY15_00455 [Firmicutes bacterium ADurb.Bin193]